MSSSSRIVELAALIHENTVKIDEYITSNALPSPSFDVSQPPILPLPQHVQNLQQALLDATDELRALMLGPVGFIASQPHNFWTSIQAIQRFGIAHSFPPTKTSTFGEIAEACSLPESDTCRLVRHAMTHYIFCEPTPGIVAHTAASKALVDIPPLSALVGFISGNLWPSAARMVDAMVKWPGSEEPNQAGFSLAHETDVPMFDAVSRDPEQGQQMADAIAFMHSGPDHSVKHVLENFDWGLATDGVLVDIGGATGTAAIEIARYLPGIHCVVQDLPDVLKGATIPEDLQIGKRLRFMAHNFFEDQPVKGADVYYLRRILHDWSNKYALKILQKLIPALKKGARVLVSEVCLPLPGVLSPYQERPARIFDLGMKMIQNGKERDAKDWANLFTDADRRFRFDGIETPAGSALSIISATWTG